MRLLYFTIVILTGLSVKAGEYLVKYHSPEAFVMAAGQMNVSPLPYTIKDSNQQGHYVVIEIPDDRVAAASANPNVEWITPNVKFSANLGGVSVATAAPELQTQWALQKVNVTSAWAKLKTRGSKNVTVAVLDTGVDYHHENLVHNIVPGFDFINDNADPEDITATLTNPGHGTHCAGIIAADGMVSGGVTGIAPETSLMPLRFLDSTGIGDLNHAIQAIDFAIEHHVQVMSMSWNNNVSRANVRGLLEAMQRADASGMIFVLTADNQSQDNDSFEIYPANANLPNSITVTSSDVNDQKPAKASFGRANVQIAAPGEDIISTFPKNTYGVSSGTSEATPLVAGAIALLKDFAPDLTGAEIRALLQVSGKAVNIENACHCRLDISAAAEMLVDRKPWMIPTAGTLKVRGTMTIAVKNARTPIQFRSSNPQVLSVNANGLVTAIAPGSAMISAVTADGQQVSSLNFYVVAFAPQPLFGSLGQQ